jgi:hypothetical protein
MTEHSFTLIIEGDVDAFLDELFDAGCDDATFGAVDGLQYGDFDREAETFSGAVASAIGDVESVDGLRVLRVEPDDFVTQAEIAKRLHRTRESIRLLAAGRRRTGSFPPPASHVRQKTRFWRWYEVAAWAGSDSASVAEARVVAAWNAALELRKARDAFPSEARALIAPLFR